MTITEKFTATFPAFKEHSLNFLYNPNKTAQLIRHLPYFLCRTLIYMYYIFIQSIGLTLEKFSKIEFIFLTFKMPTSVNRDKRICLKVSTLQFHLQRFIFIRIVFLHYP